MFVSKINQGHKLTYLVHKLIQRNSQKFGPLKGIKVLEFEGLAPTVFTGMILADFGADVTIINRQKNKNPIGIDAHNTYLNRGKRSLVADLKDPFHIDVLKHMFQSADVVIDCFRPGKLERLGLGPSQIDNQSLIFARLTGFGQTGPLKDKAGHDINYLSYSGILSTLGKVNECPSPPMNLLADFAGGGAFGVIGITLALFERERTKKGQVVDISLTDSVAYLGSFVQNMKKIGTWNQPRGQNLLDGGAPFYQTYQCSDGKYVAVGCIENQFFRRFVTGLGLSNAEELANTQLNSSNYPAVREQFKQAFLSKTRDQWMDILLPLDCCVSPVVEMETLNVHPGLNKLILKQSDEPHGFQYAPQPVLSNHQEPAQFKESPKRGQHTIEVLKQYGVSDSDIQKFTANKKP